MRAQVFGLFALATFTGCVVAETETVREVTVEVPEICVERADCDDGDPETTDFCQADGICGAQLVYFIPLACDDEGDCQDDDPDTRTFCNSETGYCQIYETVERERVCRFDLDCDDAMPWTEDHCEPDGCHHIHPTTQRILNVDRSLLLTDGTAEQPTARQGEFNARLAAVEIYPSSSEAVDVDTITLRDRTDLTTTLDYDYSLRSFFSRLRLVTTEGEILGTEIDLDRAETAMFHTFTFPSRRVTYGSRLRVFIEVDVRDSTPPVALINGPRAIFDISSVTGTGFETSAFYTGSAADLQRTYIAEKDDFFFCGEVDGYPAIAWGHTGCCAREGVSFRRGTTSGPASIPMQSLIKGTLGVVYYWAADGRRFVFPNADTLASWFQDPRAETLRDNAPFVCPQVTEIADAELAAISIGGNVLFRPGSVITGIASDPARYVVTRGGILRRFFEITFFPDGPAVFPARSDRIYLLADHFFTNYRGGPDITSAEEYDPASEWGTTLADETGTRSP